MTERVKTKIIGKDLPNIPWQEPQGGEKLPVWRYNGNPIIERFATRNSNSIFNSAVVPFADGYAGVLPEMQSAHQISPSDTRLC